MTTSISEDTEEFVRFLDREMADRESERFWKRYREQYFVPKENDKKKRRRKKNDDQGRTGVCD